MNRSPLASILVALMLVAGPGLGQSLAPTPRVEALPTVALPPELDRVIRDYERAWRAGDAAALASLFADDGLVLQSNRPPVRGRAAIRAAYDGQGGGPLALRALAFAAGDSIATIVGAYGYGGERGDVGKFTLTLRRDPGGPWLIASDMDNANAEPPRRSPPDPNR